MTETLLMLLCDLDNIVQKIKSEVSKSHSGITLAPGDRMPDGTVCLAVNGDTALFVPEGIFGGKETFDNQDKVVKKANAGNGTHGHKDWRRITDAEGETISKEWEKVAPPNQQGSAAPWFWLASPYYIDFGRVRRGGGADWNLDDRYVSLPVPVVRSGPARS